MINYPFQPIANTANISAASTTANVQVITTWPKGGGNVRVLNKSTDTIAYVAFGGSTQTAVVTQSMPILPMSVELFTVGELQTYLAAITSAGTASLGLTPGQGGI